METRFRTHVIELGNPSELQLQVLQSTEEFQALQGEWEAFADEVTDNIFLTFAWLDEWWRVYGAEHGLYTLVVRCGGEMVGVLPLMFQTGLLGVRRLQFMGSGEVTPNHLDVLVRPAERSAVIELLAAHLYSVRSSWDVLELNKLLADSGFAQALEMYFCARRLTTELVVYSRCSFIQLPATFTEYIQSLSSNRRRNLRKDKNRLLNEYPDAKFALVQTPDKLTMVMDRLVELHQARWKSKGYPGAFATHHFRQFHENVAKRFLCSGQLRLFYLEVDSSIIAIDYDFQIGNVLHSYLPGFDEKWSKHSPGTSLLVYSIEAAIAQGLDEVDFLEGDEAYKSDWTTHVRENLRLRIYAPTWRGILLNIKNQMVLKIKDLGLRFVPVFIRRPVWQLYLKWRAASQDDSL